MGDQGNLHPSEPYAARPRYWILGLWIVPGILSLAGTLYAWWLRSQMTPGESDHQREIAGQFFHCIMITCIVSVAGLVFMLVTVGFISMGRGRPRESGLKFKLLEFGILLMHLAPWLWFLMRALRAL